MSLDQFLENPYGHDSGNGNKPVIAKAIVHPAWEVSFGGSERTYFEYETDTSGENEAQAKQLAEGVAGSDGFVNLGIVTIIFAEDAIQSNFNEDWYSFVPAYHSKEKFYITPRGEEKLRENGYLDAVKELISNGGPFPYDTLIKHLKENRSVFQTEKWCRLVQKDETVLQAKGYSTQFFVVEKVYESREDALADNEVASPPVSGEVIFDAVAGGALSEKAIKNNWTLAGLQEDAQTIHQEITKLADELGKGPEALPAKKAAKEARKLTAINWAVSEKDFDLLDFDLPF